MVSERFISDSIKIGIVESVDDPTKSGHIKVRVPGICDDVPTSQLPWVSMAASSTTSGGGGGNISVPEVGSEVRVSFKGNDITSMEWSGNNKIDSALAQEIASDYEGTTVLMHDTRQGASIKFQKGSGLTFYYAGSHIQICPDNTINIHYGEGNSGTLIQLADGKISIQGNTELNLSTSGTINLEANNINLTGNGGINIKGNMPGEFAINGNALLTYLSVLAFQVDSLTGSNEASMQLNTNKEAILNQNIQYT